MTNASAIVIIVAEEKDYHALGVAKSVEKMGGEAVIIDNSQFPRKITLEHADGPDGINSKFTLSTGQSVDLSSVSGVWWRRPQKYLIDDRIGHPTLRRFAFDECREAFLGALAASVANFINPTGNSRFASHKLVQLARARQFGLNVPRTLVTNCGPVAEQFGTRQNAVFKTFTGCDFGFFETRLLGKSALQNIDQINLAPAILQEAIGGSLDIRATVVGDEVFAAELDLSHSTHPVDGRIDRVPIKKHDLPEDLQTKLIGLTKSFGLTYSAIDLRLVSGDNYIFFELNPEGQFLWVEIEAKLGICDALARALINR